MVVSDGRTTGHSTDGDGFLRSLADADVEVAGRSVLVLGGGGAARAVARALGGAGARVEVSARRAGAAAVAAGLAGGGAVDWNDRAAAAAAADIVVNATPVGMAGDPMLPIPEHVLGPGRAVVDLVYEPLETPLLAAARARGAVAVSGLGMLVHQAALQVELWSGRPAPIEAMQAATQLLTVSLKQLWAGRRCWSLEASRRPVGVLVLQGTFETLSLPEVLGLLASARKTGALWLEAGPITGVAHLEDGHCLAAEAGELSGPVDDGGALLGRLVDLCFAVMCQESGSFRFAADDPAPWSCADRVELSDVLVEVDRLLKQWREILRVIPSLECRPQLLDVAAGRGARRRS